MFWASIAIWEMMIKYLFLSIFITMEINSQIPLLLVYICNICNVND